MKGRLLPILLPLAAGFYLDLTDFNYGFYAPGEKLTLHGNEEQLRQIHEESGGIYRFGSKYNIFSQILRRNIQSMFYCVGKFLAV